MLASKNLGKDCTTQEKFKNLWPTTLLGIDEHPGFSQQFFRSISSWLCFRGSYRWHAAKGFHGNKGEPSGSGVACKVRQASKARRI
jgi:hypothetical protein